MISILKACNDKNLFRPWFRRPDTWQAWFAFLAALFALPLTPQQRAIYQQCTGRTDPPSKVAREAWLVCGRRAGKSFILALVAVFLACFFNYRQFLAPGERGTVFVIAKDRKQARVILRYIAALLRGVPMLRRMIESETAEAFGINNQVTIEVATASFRSVRGNQIVGLERRTARSGRDSIDHAPGGHDDVANAVAGAIVLAASKRGSMKIPDQALVKARLPPALAYLVHRTSRSPSPTMGMDSVSASDRADSRPKYGPARVFPTQPDHVGSTSWSDVHDR